MATNGVIFSRHAAISANHIFNNVVGAGGSASNVLAISMNAGNVGIGTSLPLSKFHVYGGDLVIDGGRITDSNQNPLIGAVAQWVPVSPPPAFTPSPAAPETAIAYTTQIGYYRGSGSEIVYNLQLAGAITTPPANSNTDFAFALPYVWSASNAVLGELWLTTVNGSTSNTFKALARAHPTDTTKAVLRFLSGTQETPCGVLVAGAGFQISGTLLYQTTATTRLMTPVSATPAALAATSNAVPLFGSAMAWRPTPTPPTLTLSSGGALTTSASSGLMRYIGTDVSYQVSYAATITTQGTGDALLSLPYPADYASNTIVGELWLTAAGANYKAYATTTTANSNVAVLRFLSGNQATSFATLTAGTVISLQGALDYKTTLVYNGDVQLNYIPSVFNQDGFNQVILNGSGYPPRGQLDILGTTPNPTLIVDSRSPQTTSIAQFRRFGDVLLTLRSDGLFYDSNENASFIPGGMMAWSAAATSPVVAPPAGGSLSNIAAAARVKYGGNAVIYNFQTTQQVSVAPASPTADYTIGLPYLLDTTKYSPAFPAALGTLQLTITSSLGYVSTFAGLIRTIPGSSNTAALRFVNGTADVSLSTIGAGNTVAINGIFEYASLQTVAPMAAAVASNVFYRDTAARVSVGSGLGPRGRLDVREGESAAIPVLYLDSAGGADALRVRTAAGGEALVIDGSGELGIGTNVPRGALDVVPTARAYPNLMRDHTLPAAQPTLLATITGEVGIGTTVPQAVLHVAGATTTLRADHYASNIEMPPTTASNATTYADFTSTVPSIDTGTPTTLVEWPPVALYSTSTNLTTATIAVAGFLYGNGNYVITSSSGYDTTLLNWKAFTKTSDNPNNGNDCWASAVAYTSGVASSPSTTVSGSAVLGSWLQIQLPTATVLKSYQLARRTGSPEQAPAVWTLAGSTDGTTWTSLDTRTGYTTTNGNWADNIYLNFPITNTTAYTYYRLIVSSLASTTGTVVTLAEWRLFGESALAVAQREYPPGSLTANTTNLYGTYAPGFYTSSASTTAGSSYTAWRAFNKNIALYAQDMWMSAASVYNVSTGAYSGTVSTTLANGTRYLGEWLRIAFPRPVRASNYAITMPTDGTMTYAPKAWYILGSQDGQTWVELQRTTGSTGWTAGVARSFAITTTEPYFYYQIIITDNNTAGAVSQVAIGEWRIYEDQTVYPKYRVALPASSAAQGAAYAPGTYSVYANTMYSALTTAALAPTALIDKLAGNTSNVPATIWRTGAAAYTYAVDASPAPSVYLEFPSAMAVRSYRMTAATITQAPSAWSIYGSNMATPGGWLLLSAQTGQIAPWYSSLTQTYATNFGAFDYYRFDFLRNVATTADFIALVELRLFGNDCTPDPKFLTVADGRVGINVSGEAALSSQAALTVGGNLALSSGGNISAGNLGLFRNRIINGDMRIDQRNNGSALTAAGYSVDRWITSQVSGGTISYRQLTAPPNPYGFSYVLSATTTTAQTSPAANAYAYISQVIEGFNIADLGWGTQYAQPITVSFYVYTNLMGTYGVALRNGGQTQSYVASFTVSVANTWIPITLTIPGCTTDIWAVDTGRGLELSILLAAGSLWRTDSTYQWINSSQSGTGYGFFAPTQMVNFTSAVGNKFYLTGVQVEKGTIATPFEFRPYATELGLCQRYYVKFSNNSLYVPIGTGMANGTTLFAGVINLPIPMRNQPILYSSAGSGTITQGTTTYTTNDVYAYIGSTNYGFTTLAVSNAITFNCSTIISITLSGGTGLTLGSSGILYIPDTSGKFIAFSSDF